MNCGTCKWYQDTRCGCPLPEWVADLFYSMPCDTDELGREERTPEDGAECAAWEAKGG
jgi:hypothetical protein